MTDRAQQFPRRKYYIDQKFQTRFIVLFLVILLVGGCLSVALTLFGTKQTLTSTYDHTGLAIQSTAMAILPSVVITTIITTVAVGFLVLVVTLLVSHKIAGPMYRFEQDLRVIAGGDLQKKIRIRDGDQFAGMMENLNAMVESFNGKVSRVQSDLDSLHAAAQEQHLPQSFLDDIEACRRSLRTEFRL